MLASLDRVNSLALATASFMKGLTTGDSNVANEGLRRFFEQKFHDSSESYAPLLR